ncbi:hypothetical protein H2200_013639 [Cladophialophora chaetospira]|uniref:Methyltransferase type 11 domain-containing protein n=1 Tax=Cladophialophora chaetospira TaxID=386627 RepID=A0AA38U9A9_9EURO|nr:hypothetical protein H2200_013639 [Cladophialophora chaetospira]
MAEDSGAETTQVLREFLYKGCHVGRVKKCLQKTIINHGTPFEVLATQKVLAEVDSVLTNLSKLLGSTKASVASSSGTWHNFRAVYTNALTLIRSIDPEKGAIGSEYGDPLLGLFIQKFGEGDIFHLETIQELCYYSTTSLSEQKRLICSLLICAEAYFRGDMWNYTVEALDIVRVLLDSEYHKNMLKLIEETLDRLTKPALLCYDTNDPATLDNFRKLNALISQQESIQFESMGINENSWRLQDARRNKKDAGKKLPKRLRRSPIKVSNGQVVWQSMRDMRKSVSNLAKERYFTLLYLAAVLFALIAVLSTAITVNGARNPSVEDYYTSWGSRLGYWLLLGNTRHCGLYPKGKLWPFPISTAQRSMEEHMFNQLGLKPGSLVLDAGTGSGHVAIFMAEKGLNVQAIDITPLHVNDARHNIQTRGLEHKISVALEDYHDLSNFTGGTFDGIYTMETFVHADDPIKVLRNFYDLLRPGGVLAQNEGDFIFYTPLLQDILRLSHCQNTLPEGALSQMLEAVGFINVQVQDLTDEVLPLWRMFGFIGYVPYRILQLLGVHMRFTNIMAGVEGYLNWG